jgi:hypothetical protein
MASKAWNICYLQKKFLLTPFVDPCSNPEVTKKCQQSNPNGFLAGEVTQTARMPA